MNAPLGRAAPIPSRKDTPQGPERRSQRIALTVLVGLALFAALWVAAPLYVGVVLGTAMAFSARPLFDRLAGRLGRRRALAAALSTVLGGTLMLAGIGSILLVVAQEIVSMAAVLRRQVAGATVESLLGGRVAHWLDLFHVDRAQFVAHAQEQLANLSGRVASVAGVLVSATTSALLTTLIALFTMYYVMLEGARLSSRLERLLPLDPRHTRALVAEFREVARAAFVGTIVTGIVQGLLAGLGFVMAGVPQPVTWGVVTVLCSFVPVFGTALVWVPVAAWLLATGRPGATAFVVAWSLGVVMALSDYVIRPRLVGRKGEGHPLLTLIGILGGIEVFGLVGLILGPVIMSLFVAILRIYERETA